MCPWYGVQANAAEAAQQLADARARLQEAAGAASEDLQRLADAEARAADSIGAADRLQQEAAAAQVPPVPVS